MRFARRAVAIAALCALCLACAQGCMVHGRGGGAPFMLGLLTAMAIHHAIELDRHDHHYHDEFCRHRRVWVEDRWLYWYGDHWEYFDYDTGRWYMVPASPPEDQQEDAEGAED